MILKTTNPSIINNKKETRYISLLELLIVFVCLAAVLTPRFLLIIPDMDEIWNYQFARRVLYGYIPYKDFYLMQTPFAPQFNSLFLLVSDKLITMRLVGITISTFVGLILYKVLRVLSINVIKSFPLIITYTLTVFFMPQNNYSWFAVLFLSAALYAEIISIEKELINKRNTFSDIIIGLLLGLCVISKQNIGCFGFLVSTAFLIYVTYNLKAFNKHQIFRLKGVTLYFLLRVSFRTLGFITAIGGELLYIWRNGAINEFIDQTFLAAGKFGAQFFIPYTSLINHHNVLFKSFAIIVPIIIAGTLFKGIFILKDFKSKSIALLLVLYALANMSMVYPIADPAHLIFGMPLTILCVPILLQDNKDNNYKGKPISTWFPIIILLYILTLMIIPMISRIKSSEISFSKYVKHYYGTPFTKNNLRSLNCINDYIIKSETLGKNIIIIDYRAAFYLIPLDKFGYKSDTLLSDTLSMGSSREKEMLKMLSSNNLTVLISSGDKPANWQESKVLRSYIRSQMEYVESLDGFDVFQSK